jgi:ABC-type polysaccharide/polyol phosphate export permease
MARVLSRASIQPRFATAFPVLWQHRDLIKAFVWRDIREQYASSLLGGLWAVLQPLVYFGTLVLVFAVGLNLNRAPDNLGKDYILHILSGLAPWLSMSVALQLALVMVHGNAALVKQMEFPVEVLAARTTLSNLPASFVGLLIAILYCLFRYQSVPVLVLALPLCIVIQIAMTIGLSWILASIAAYWRDFQQIVTMLLFLNLYLTPIFFTGDNIPGPLSMIVRLNPFSPFVEMYQAAFRDDSAVFLIAAGISSVTALAVFLVGYRVLLALRPGFADVV